jgi:hypothetical protein
MGFDSLDKFITGIDIDPGVAIGRHKARHLSDAETVGQQRQLVSFTTARLFLRMVTANREVS